MRFLFDQNISHRIHKKLDAYFENSFSIKEKGLINASDEEIWEVCKSEELHIITQDADFNFIQSLRGFPPKIIWLRLGNQNTGFLAKVLNENIESIQSFLIHKEYGILEISGKQ